MVDEEAVNYDRIQDFIDFVAERHKIWEYRQAGVKQPWTSDRTLATKKFTNIFRVLDPGSQFVFNLETDNLQDLLARLTLYRYTNYPPTWEFMKKEGGTGDYPLADHMNADLAELISSIPGQKFSGAYMIIPQPGRKGDKVEMVVDLAARVAASCGEFDAATTQAERHAVLKSHYGVGDFLGLQILTDWGYFQHKDREDQFVVLGPGSHRGLLALGFDRPKADDIYTMQEILHEDERCPTLAGYKPSTMNVQNCLCEFSKWVKGPVNNTYRPAHPGVQPTPTMPVFWR